MARRRRQADVARQVGRVQPHLGADLLHDRTDPNANPNPNPNPNPNLNPNPNQVQISFMAAAPGHAFFRCALQRAVRNIETGHYGPGDLSLSLSLSLSLPLTLTLRRATTGQVISLSRGRRSLAPASTR